MSHQIYGTMSDSVVRIIVLLFQEPIQSQSKNYVHGKRAHTHTNTNNILSSNILI